METVHILTNLSTCLGPIKALTLLRVTDLVSSALKQMRTRGRLRRSDIHRWFILWNSLQSQGNVQKRYFWHSLFCWHTLLICQVGVKMLITAVTWKVGPTGTFHSGGHSRPLVLLASSTKIQPQKIILVPSYLRILLQIFSLSGTSCSKIFTWLFSLII